MHARAHPFDACRVRRGADACPAQVVLLYLSEEAPTEGTKPSEALILHGCTVEAMEATENGAPSNSANTAPRGSAVGASRSGRAPGAATGATLGA